MRSNLRQIGMGFAQYMDTRGATAMFPVCTELSTVPRPLPLPQNLPTIDKVLYDYCGKDQALFRCPDDYKYYPPPPDGQGTKLSYDYPVGYFTTTTTDFPPRIIGKTRANVMITRSGVKRSSSTIQMMYDYEAFHGPAGDAVGAMNFLYLDGHVDDQ